MKKKTILTPSTRVFHELIGILEDIELKESTLDTKAGDIIVLTGSILDKSEIDYRNITKTQGIYYTLIPEHYNKKEIDDYWHKYTSVLYKYEFIRLFEHYIL